MKDSVFRQYDIRGIVGSEFIIDQVYSLTQAIAHYIYNKNPTACTIALGFDGRHHSPEIVERACASLVDSGFEVYFLGMCPSPALYFAQHIYQFDAAIMITASHNSKEYNGMKLCLATHSIWGKEITYIKKLYQEQSTLNRNIKGSVINYPIVPIYTQWLIEHFAHIKGSHVPMVVDCAHGVAGLVLPELIRQLQLPITLLYETIDGDFPAHEADPIIEQNMQDVRKALLAQSPRVGIGFDGDADRLAAMTETGKLLTGDQLFAIFAQQLKKHHPESSMVFDIKVSQGLLDVMQQWNVPFYISPSGHAIVKEYMKKHRAILAGELSCHFLFADRYFGFDDGIYALLRLIELLSSTKQQLSELSAMLPLLYSSPEIRIACDESLIPSMIQGIKKAFEAQKVQIWEIDGIRVTTQYGWGLLRASHTKPEITMRFEGKTDHGLRQIKKNFYTILVHYFDKTLLKQMLQL